MANLFLHCRRLVAIAGDRSVTRPSLALYLESAIQGFFPRAFTVKLGFTVLHPSDTTKTVRKEITECCYGPSKRSRGFNAFMDLAVLEQQQFGFMDERKRISVAVDVTVKAPTVRLQGAEPEWAAPPERSLTGDTRLILDDGTTLQAHALYLQHASEVLTGALACTAEQPAAAAEASDDTRATRNTAKRPRTASTASAPGTEFKLPLRGASRKQALLLLSCLYAFARDAWVWELGPADQMELARLAHRYQCIEVLQLVDASLVKMSEAEEELSQDTYVEMGWLNEFDAPKLLDMARDLSLAGFEARVLRFIGRHPDTVSLRDMDPGIAAVIAASRSVRS